jgi:hypothetical protein
VNCYAVRIFMNLFLLWRAVLVYKALSNRLYIDFVEFSEYWFVKIYLSFLANLLNRKIISIVSILNCLVLRSRMHGAVCPLTHTSSCQAYLDTRDCYKTAQQFGSQVVVHCRVLNSVGF